MSKARHTPGPWQVIFINGGKPKPMYRQPKNIVAICENGHAVATVSGESGGPQAAPANARLIAAAPDLLAACKQICERYDTHDNPDIDRNEFATARAAIAKAELEK